VLTFDWQTLMRQFWLNADLEGSKIGGAEMAAAKLDGVKLAGTGYSVDDLKKSSTATKSLKKMPNPEHPLDAATIISVHFRTSPARRQ